MTAFVDDPSLAPGQLRFVQIDGEIGVGKSALLSAVIGRLRERGRRESQGSSASRRSSAPAPHISLAQGDRLHADGPLTAFRAFLEGLLDEPLEQLLDTATPAVLALRCIEELTDTPLLLAVDDAQWLDPASMVFLETLMQHAAAGPVTIVVAHRFGTAPWNLVMAARRRGALQTHHTVEALSDAAIARLAEGLPEHQVAAVVQAANGNPLFAHAVTAGFRRHSEASHADEVLKLAGESHTAVLASAIAADLDTLEDPARRTLETLAVVGQRDAESLARVAGLSPEQVETSLRVLEERGLLTASPHEALHPVVRFSVYQSTDRARRAAAHRRAANLPGAELFDRADHLSGALTAGAPITGAATPLTPAETEVLVEAAGVAIGSEPRAVARWLGGLPPALRTPRSETLLARALILTGDFDNAIKRLRAVIRDADAPEAQVLLANALRITGHTGEARALLATAHDWAGEADPALLREYTDMVALIDGHPPEALVSRLESLPDPLWSDLNRTVAAIYRTMTLLAEGRVPQARVTFQRVKAWAETVTNDELASAPHAVSCAVWVAYMLDQYETGAALSRRALQVARRHGQADVLANIGTALSYCQASLGLLDEADRTGEQAIRDAERYGPPSLISMARAGLMISAMGRNDPELLRRRFDAVMATPLPEFGWWRRAVLTTRSRVSALLGRPEPYPELLGEPKDAMAALRYADAAVVSAMQGDPDTARSLISEGLAIADEQEQAGQRGMILTTAAELLLRSGDPLQAGNLFRTARDIFEQCGMRLQLGRAQAGLARAETALAEQAEPLAQLTGREREVVQLIGNGARNSQIAARLSLSKRTVEYHVSNVLKKLGLKTREDIARIAQPSAAPDPLGARDGRASGRAPAIRIGRERPPTHPDGP